ncbi:MAG: acyl-CoA dehydrogenase [Desulfobacteraceae bacterium]|jgi:alkylation response protein AidB-like acyl-CoA dehydrogenase|nr:acyl-CoA dehydrogenase [Desulfobacteraceae bacterium]
MAQQIADRRDIDFVLYEQFDTENTLAHERYGDYNRKSVDLLLTEARRFALKEILPTYTEGDRHGARFENGMVRAPECYRKPFKLFREGEWSALSEDPQVGGQGLPYLINAAANEYLMGTNFAFASYALLGHGTGKMIELFGTEELKKKFLKKLYKAEWGGTMLLTEPGAGSDVGALVTSARKNDDGTYSISGNKIFITAGEHDLTDNIIHPVLARIEGAPAGTAGISLFIVPKIWVNDDGALGKPNDVVCTGIEEKMGLHGSATCSLTLGGKGNCKGFLLGEENRGMRVMFHMMNEARLGVGIQALVHASAAYLHALDYARQRRQGRALEKMLEKEAPAVPIINHPDVRRMLLGMKSQVEGMRSFAYYLTHCLEQTEIGEDEEKIRFYKGMADLLTPILKTYNANIGFEICVQAIQIYGGYGYTQEYPVEQLARDCKIASIYEGTDGIQAMDLLVRKIGMQKGKVFLGFIQEIQQVLMRAQKDSRLAGLAGEMAPVVQRLGEVALHMGQTAVSPDFKVAFAHSMPFLMVMGEVVMAWMLLWRACIASEKLDKEVAKKDAAFYRGQVKSAEYFIQNQLPITLGKIASITRSGKAAVEIDEDAFGG